MIPFVVPDDKDQHHPCLAYWQWGVNGAGAPNVNIKFTGQFRRPIDDMVEVGAYDVDYYWFIWSLKTNQFSWSTREVSCVGHPPSWIWSTRYVHSTPSPPRFPDIRLRDIDCCPVRT